MDLDHHILEQTTTTECKICNVVLPHINTTNAHYSSKKHLKNVAAYLENLKFNENSVKNNICQIPLVYQKPDLKPAQKIVAPPGNTVISAISEVKNNFAKQKDMVNAPNPSRTKTFNSNAVSESRCSKSNQKTLELRTEICTELEKLVESLYYSNKIPQEVSLSYLKKVNSEVKALIEKHANTDSVKKGKIGNVFLPEAKAAIVETEVPTSSKKVETKAIIETGTSTSLKTVGTKEVKPMKLEKTLPIKESKEAPASNSKPETNWFFVLSDLLTDIVDEKRRVQKSEDDGIAVKLQVISEIEVLLLQVSEPNLPLQEILNCLKKYNGFIENEKLFYTNQGISPQCPGTNDRCNEM